MLKSMSLRGSGGRGGVRTEVYGSAWVSGGSRAEVYVSVWFKGWLRAV